MSMYRDERMPTLEEIRARVIRPEKHRNDVIILVNGHHVWKPRAQLRPDEPFVAFFSGDLSKVLEPDDPRIAQPAQE